uniref:SEC63 domain-containing protein n=1 Tax=Caenorhabditis japonica TaxID=281687 RepID=A0A8R1HT20_CAEJA
MDTENRRAVLRTLSADQYRDVMVVLSMMPHLQIEHKAVVEGEDDQHELTAGCYMTLKVTLRRHRLIDPLAAGLSDQLKAYESGEEDEGEEKEEVEGEADKEEKKTTKKPWEKNKQKKKKKGGNVQKKQVKKQVAPQSSPSAEPLLPVEEEKKPEEDEDSEGSDDDSAASDSENTSQKNGSDNNGNESESDWEDDVAQKKNIFETKSVETHLVHAPFYPVDKYEWWWVTLAHVDKKEKSRQIMAPPQIVKTLVNEQTVDIRFPAPPHKGTYNYNLSVKSDSYMDADYSVNFKLDVKEAKVVEYKHENYVDEDEEAVEASSDEEYTEGSDSDDDEE